MAVLKRLVGHGGSLYGVAVAVAFRGRGALRYARHLLALGESVADFGAGVPVHHLTHLPVDDVGEHAGIGHVLADGGYVVSVYELALRAVGHVALIVEYLYLLDGEVAEKAYCR